MNSSTPPSYRGPLLTIVRHGETEANVAHVLQGQTDSLLTPRGQAQVLALGKRWRINDGNIDRNATTSTSTSAESLTSQTCVNGLPVPRIIVSSPTGRARTTASSIFLGVQSHLSPKETKDPSFSEGGELIQAAMVPVQSLTSDYDRSSLPDSSSTPPTLLLDPLLMEKDFGNLEGTRRRVHVPGFASPSPTMRGESHDAFAGRIRDVGRQWLTAVGMGDAVNRYGTPIQGKQKKVGSETSADGTQSSDAASIKKAMEEADRLAAHMQGDEQAGEQERDSDPRSAKRKRIERSADKPQAPAPNAPSSSTATALGTAQETVTTTEPRADLDASSPPHLVIVTHGLVISTFLNYFQPASDRPSTPTSSYPFASNTGYFTLGIRPTNRLAKTGSGSVGLSQPKAPAQELFLLRTNDTAHLAGLGGLSRGSPKREKGLQSISSFFVKKS
ncbi:unnamed protein product [Tilletia controversa]|uniref:Uncharacterized protein n=3 Tax=Tilletia TaxID=13289 RepID=A0A8X7MXZ1_9BASI|nr:hypothetical protein CF336_g399 [Tilletia laevis]KAE8202855.1 hypothetical protein CF328_g1985 [Tilletia controversa]KAE8263496.1 hypothetical protein A4X03_0g1634 [Tilletia caries]KAE8207071.1 hypothetical protein CF335_g1422 [Tilletia laevis]KAE8253856.1 hypothetical protein A4X06_0g1190 [Tilletia controversa]